METGVLDLLQLHFLMSVWCRWLLNWLGYMGGMWLHLNLQLVEGRSRNSYLRVWLAQVVISSNSTTAHYKCYSNWVIRIAAILMNSNCLSKLYNKLPLDQVETVFLVAVLLGRLCLHLPAHTQASFKDHLRNVGGSLWLIPFNAQ